MARVKRAVNALKKRRKIMKRAKGFFGARSKQYRIAKSAVMKAMAHAYEGRKHRKRDFRSLWIVRINAAARMNDISYSRLMNGLKKAGIEVNRKILAELAVNDSKAFASLVQKAKAALTA